ncbi:MAG: hypothetical protein Q8P22_06825, partial [Chloroflexota bacterium]|nr:hypothetical protein [Chloroflexota bacterium]
PAEQGEGKSVAELVVSPRPMELQVGEKGLRARFGEVTVWLQLIQGSYPNYTQLIPTGHKSRLTFLVEELTRAVKTVQGMAKDGSGIVRFRYEPGRLTVAAVAAEVGNVETSIPVQLEGETGWIGFSSKYLLGYLKGREGVIVLELNEPSNPGVFIHRGEKVVVMPMFISGEDKGTPPTPEVQAEATAEPPSAAEDEEMDDEEARLEEPSTDVKQDEGPPPPEVEAEMNAQQAATEEKPKRPRKRKAKTTE